MKLINFTLVVFIFSLMACEKTIDSESIRWTNNQARLERLISEYPNLSKALQSQLDGAASAFEKAKEVTDEIAKIEAMDRANDIASARFITDLDNLDKKIEKLRESSIKLLEYSENNKGILVAGLKSVNVESAITESKNYLSFVVAKNKVQAEQAVNKAIGPLDRLQKSISDSIREMEREQRKKVEG